MLHKTSGIVLSFIKYSETSIITKIYTEKFGIQSYIVNGVRSKSSKNKIGLFQPLTLLDLVVYHKSSSNLQRIAEVRCLAPYSSIPFNRKKLCISIFITEILTKTLKEEVENKELFNFISSSILYLDLTTDTFESFHLSFLIDLSNYLGFGPTEISDIIDPKVIKVISEEEKNYISSLILRKPVNDKVSNLTRRNVLLHIVKFYTLQIEGFGDINSLEILKEVMN